MRRASLPVSSASHLASRAQARAKSTVTDSFLSLSGSSALLPSGSQDRQRRERCQSKRPLLRPTTALPVGRRSIKKGEKMRFSDTNQIHSARKLAWLVAFLAVLGAVNCGGGTGTPP